MEPTWSPDLNFYGPSPLQGFKFTPPSIWNRHGLDVGRNKAYKIEIQGPSRVKQSVYNHMADGFVLSGSSNPDKSCVNAFLFKMKWYINRKLIELELACVAE